MSGDLPPDAHELLPDDAIEHWTSGARFPEGFFDEEAEAYLLRNEEWYDYLRNERGFSEIEVACACQRMLLRLAEEHFGLIERVTLPDGSAVLYERDPFADLPTTEDG